jgi:hypothetical protein
MLSSDWIYSGVERGDGLAMAAGGAGPTQSVEHHEVVDDAVRYQALHRSDVLLAA